MFSNPNSGPQTMLSFLKDGAWRYVFQMSAAKTSSPFRAAYKKAIQMLSLDTTPEKVDPSGSGVLCPSKTHLALHMKSIFTSQTKWLVTFCQPFGGNWPGANIVKAHTSLLQVLSSNSHCHSCDQFP